MAKTAEGDKKAKGEKESGICLKPDLTRGCTKLTETRVRELAKMLTKGKSGESIIDYCCKTYNIMPSQAKQYYFAALNYLKPKDENEFRNGLIATNMKRLETIIEKVMSEDKQNLKLAKEAISELNKMLGVGDKTAVAIQNVSKEGEENNIIITFDK